MYLVLLLSASVKCLKWKWKMSGQESEKTNDHFFSKSKWFAESIQYFKMYAIFIWENHLFLLALSLSSLESLAEMVGLV